MKALIRTLYLCTLLAALLSVLFTLVVLFVSAKSDSLQLTATCGLFLLPPFAVWLTIKAVSSLPQNWLLRAIFRAVASAGWLATSLAAQGRYESNPEYLAIFYSAVGLIVIAAAWLIAKTRCFPTLRGIGEAMTGAAILAAVCAVWIWHYDARTQTIAAQAEARWAEIGLPIAEFEKTLATGQENAGSEVFRQVLRDRVGTRFYKEGTAAADKEPAIAPSELVDELCIRAANISGTALPKSDDFDFVEPTDALQKMRVKKVKFSGSIPDSPMLSTAEIEAASQALDTDYRRILAEEPPVWASDPHDMYFISVPNFLGVRKFAQLASADALRRFAKGDEEGAARAIAAGLQIGKRMRDNPTLVSLMIHVAVESLLTAREVRLPATEDGLPSIARDAAVLRAEFLKRVQIESWAQLRTIDNANPDQNIFTIKIPYLPRWARRIGNRRLLQRQLALGTLNGAEHAAILQSPAASARPDLGQSLHEAVSAKYPSAVEPFWMRALMRIQATLLLREQVELIRESRARLAAGLPVESRDSTVQPGARWELIADAEKNTVATRLAGAPDWLVTVAPPAFWELPLDGSVAWQFHTPANTASSH